METGTGHFNPTGPLSPIHESDLESNNLQTLGSNPEPTVKSPAQLPATNNNEILKIQDLETETETSKIPVLKWLAVFVFFLKDFFV